MAAQPEDVCPCCGGPYPTLADRQRAIVSEAEAALAEARAAFSPAEEGEDG